MTAHPAPLGLIVNPSSGRDARRIFARADRSTIESKRNQVERILVGAVAAGVRQAMFGREPFRVAEAASDALGVSLERVILDTGGHCSWRDTESAVRQMREAGCGALVVLGGDGTNRIVARTWPDAPILPVSTGTNNVFPAMLEATVAGAAAGLVASGRIAPDSAGRRAKVVRVEIEGERDDLALIDAVLLVGDHMGSYLPVEPVHMRTLLLTRAVPDAVGMSPVGGLLTPCGAHEDAGVLVECSESCETGRPLLAPVSPGLYRVVHVAGHRRVALGEAVEVTGPGLLAFDGDRERVLAPGQRARLRIERNGPFVIDAGRTLGLASQQGLYLDPVDWHDARSQLHGVGCC